MDKRDVIAIGGSLGAIEAVKQLCRDLPADLAATMFIVIHIGAHGMNRLADIFGAQSAFPVTTAVHGERLQRGHAYVAPADHHLLVIDGVAILGRGPRENMARPAIDPLFRSVAMSYGPRAIAVVLTGMLNDGAAGLADVKRCGGTTVVQNPADALAADMPWGALLGSDVDHRAPLSQMAALLTRLSAQEAGPPVPVPAEVRIEVDIALGRVTGTQTLASISDPVGLSCPACGGILSQVRRSSPLRFRCQVGHGYTAESLATEKEESVDEALRVALRIMEERALLTQKMADEARGAGREATAASYSERSRESRAYADILKRGIEKM
ncbi:chemotaxis protein CheB [Achromobacter xylosoxidans]|uniref:chemotaxis protein CheB n=1 Tax=Alcaligenes xylosoxydans xylosoxydans TaxID=85698 RepID=UPI0022B8E1DA|nr:chemotaxis protein CheB [Achromobacter xylosoxidans]MCZ8390214.1 chemotaxis protein CheB [Achromobacter xylosoxidans]